jgi:hypothetical protein
MVTRISFTRVSARKIHFLGIKIKTRLKFLGKMILKMNLVVKWCLGDGACGNVGGWNQ